MGCTKSEQVGLWELADKLKVSASTLSRIEQGNYHATVENLIPVVHYLGHTLDDYVVEI